MKPSPRTITFTLGLLVAVFLAGCGSTPVDAPEPSPAGAEERLAFFSYRDTRLEIINKTGETRTLKWGAGCVDLSGYLAQDIYVNDPISQVGWCGMSDRDVSGEFARGKWPNREWIPFHAHNPKVGYPSISIDGVEHGFSVYESCAYKTQGEIFEGTRRANGTGAVSMVITWVNSTTLLDC